MSKDIMTGAVWLLIVVAVYGRNDTNNVNNLEGCHAFDLQYAPDHGAVQATIKHPSPHPHPEYNFLCDITLSNKEIVLEEVKQTSIKYLQITLSQELIDISFQQDIFSPNLKNLSIVAYCSFHISSNTFTGLKTLQQLSIAQVRDTKNGSVDEPFSSFAPDWLESLSGLTDLSLFSVKMASFLSMQFCHLRQLQNLYLWDVNMESTAAMTCNSSQEACYPCLPKLSTLFILNNPIQRLGNEFLKNLPVLEHLEISQCSLSSFNLGDICMHSIGINHIDVHGNELTEIEVQSPDTCNCSQLEIWLLGNNKLRNLPRGMFMCTSDLKKLDLASNYINQRVLIGARLNSLSKLKVLDLSHNNITTLDSALIGKMTELMEFACSNCGLTRIRNDTFNHLQNLTVLRLDRNLLSIIAAGVFANLVNLKSLDLTRNKLKNTQFLSDLQSLEELYVGNNLLTEVPDFPGSWERLTILRLERNNIIEVKELQLSGLTRLKRLSLAFNHIKSIPDHTFSNSNTLEHLFLNNNGIRYFGKNRLPRLNYLGLDNNFIDRTKHFESFYIGNVQNLNLSRNSIKTLNFLYDNFQLEWIDLSWNSISEINFNFNNVFLHLKGVNLSFNKLRILKEDVFTTGSSPRTRVYLEGNPLHCDCHSEWLLYTKEDIARTSTNAYLRVPDLDLLKCASSTVGKNLSFSSITPNDLVCQYNTSCFPQCSCYSNNQGTANFMNCSSRGLNMLSSPGPMTARDVYLDNNNLTSLNSSVLNFPHLQKLFIYNNHISEIQTGAFSDLILLTLLDLNQNAMENIWQGTFLNLSTLEELYLNGNRIHYIENGSFDDLMRLKILWLHGNALTNIDLTLFDKMYSLGGLSLYDNPWFCGCQFGPEFKKWVAYSKIIQSASLIHCSDILPPDGFEAIANITSEAATIDGKNSRSIQTTPHHQDLIHSEFSHCSEKHFVYTKSIIEVLILSATFAILLILILTIFKTRLLIKVWFYNKFGVRFHKEEKDNDEKPYDVFIAYAKADERLVVFDLLPQLENADMSYRVCVECRDWPPAAATTEMIISSVQKSKRTIILVSPNHLDTQWCEYSFDAAHYQVLTDKQIRLILVLTDLELEARMTRAMKLYMKTNTYLVIGERWFWRKLRFYLADNPRGADDVVERDFDLLEVY